MTMNIFQQSKVFTLILRILLGVFSLYEAWLDNGQKKVLFYDKKKKGGFDNSESEHLLSIR